MISVLALSLHEMYLVLLFEVKGHTTLTTLPLSLYGVLSMDFGFHAYIYVTSPKASTPCVCPSSCTLPLLRIASPMSLWTVKLTCHVIHYVIGGALTYQTMTTPTYHGNMIVQCTSNLYLTLLHPCLHVAVVRGVASILLYDGLTSDKVFWELSWQPRTKMMSVTLPQSPPQSSQFL